MKIEGVNIRITLTNIEKRDNYEHQTDKLIFNK